MGGAVIQVQNADEFAAAIKGSTFSATAAVVDFTVRRERRPWPGAGPRASRQGAHESDRPCIQSAPAP
jgi:hypothetical protein